METYSISANRINDASCFHVNFSESQNVSAPLPYGSTMTATPFTVEKIAKEEISRNEAGVCLLLQREIVSEGVILGIPPRYELGDLDFDATVNAVVSALSASAYWLKDEMSSAVAGEINALIGDEPAVFALFAENAPDGDLMVLFVQVCVNYFGHSPFFVTAAAASAD